MARFRKQTGVVGELATGRQEIDDRWALFITLRSVEKGTTAIEAPPSPVLFEPKVIQACDDQLRFSGLERTADRAWCLQEWDCFVLPERRSM